MAKRGLVFKWKIEGMVFERGVGILQLFDRGWDEKNEHDVMQSGILSEGIALSVRYESSIVTMPMIEPINPKAIETMVSLDTER